MSDFVLIDGDLVTFLPTFGAATVVVRPGSLRASGPACLGGKKLCVDGDEKKVSVPGCTYMTPQFSIPGMGTLKIAALAGNQKARKGATGGKSLLLKGNQFTAELTVTSPAKQPPPGPGSPIPDPLPRYSGNGSFVTTNPKLKAS